MQHVVHEPISAQSDKKAFTTKIVIARTAECDGEL